MTIAAAQRTGLRPGLPLLALILALALPAVALTLRDAIGVASASQWVAALLDPDESDVAQLLARHVFLPRIAVALLAGAGLALAGTILQQALRNPLADPTTLGTSAGAALALTAATLYAPWLLEGGREGVALAGAAAATLLAFGLSARQAFSPITLVLSGLVVTLVAGSAAATLMALKSDYVSEIFVWQSGSLVQNGNGAATGLAWRLALAAAVSLLLLRPLTVLGLDDRAAGALGISPRVIRLLAVSMAIVLAAAVTAIVGVIAFVGLAAPALARLAGARTLRARMAVAPVLGALLLLLTDRSVATYFGTVEIPAGAATAILGAPLLFALLPLVRGSLPGAEWALDPASRPPRISLAWFAVALGLAVLVAIGFGREWGGWGWLSPAEWDGVLSLRAPRVLAAGSAGVLLAVAGVVLQRVTGNPMASPEFMGVSGGATLGVVILLLATSGLDRLFVLGAAGLGAAAATVLILALSGRGSHAPERLLLMGISVATLASSLAALMLASGDPRVQWLQAWLAGSTYRAAWPDALVGIGGAAVVLALMLLSLRWLVILPLGPSISSAIGLPVRTARILLVMLAAGATALATLTVGPLSFVGLMAPHLARMMGFRRPAEQLFAAALIGAAILILADWLGRTIIYPWQIPAGLLAALMGAPVFAWLMRGAGRNAST